MASPADDPPITLEEVRTAAVARELPALVGRLVRERSWGALVLLFEHARRGSGPISIGLPDLDTAVRALAEALALVPAPRNARAPLADELRTVRLSAAESLLGRCARPPLTELERRMLGRAAALLSDAGDKARAAALHEELGDDERAAEAWGAQGDLDRMEAALARDDAKLGSRRAAVDAMRRFEVLMTGGERRQAVAAAGEIAAGAQEAATARQLAARVDARLVRGHAVTLRVPGGDAVRVAALPARLGRDVHAEVVLRDPGVSRQHACIRRAAAGLVLEDAGSRGGVRVSGARIAGAWPLRGDGEFGLGPTTTLRFESDGADRVLLRGAAGLDRQLVALLGDEPLPLALAIPGTEGLALGFSGDFARLVRRPDIPVRVDGHFIGAGCDLLHGDVIELPRGAVPLRLEVE